MRGPVIVTRPAAPGQRLANALRAREHEVAWWPAFDIAPPADEAAVRRALDHLADYDLALFVSPNAVHATASRLTAGWPATTVIGAVGASTRVAALAEIPGAAKAPIIAPAEGDESGSEGFWRAWRASGRQARRVLLLRAATGRDWIIDQLRAVDAQVDALAVYDRVSHPLTEGDRARLQAWIAARAVPSTVVTSAEAVGTLVEQVAVVADAAGWLKGGRAIATHPRIAQRLHAEGFAHVVVCDPSDPAIIDGLESTQG